MAGLRGRGIDPRAYLCQRAWLPAGVKVQVVDPADPTPYWLISSRQPGLPSPTRSTVQRRPSTH